MTQFSGIKAGGKTYDIWATKAEVEALNNQGNAGLAREVTAGKTAIANAIVAKGGTATSSQSLTELAQDVAGIPNFINYRDAFFKALSSAKTAASSIDNFSGKLDDTDIDYYYSIGNYQLYNNQNITEVKLNKCVSLGAYVFSNSSIEKLEINNNTFVSVFCSNCPNLKSIKLNSLTTLDSFYFHNLPMLDDLQIPNVTTIRIPNISEQIFGNCVSLKILNLPNCVSISYVRTSSIGYLPNLESLTLGKLTTYQSGVGGLLGSIKLANIVIGNGTGIDLDFSSWNPTSVVTSTLNANFKTGILDNLYDYSAGTAHTIRIGWLSRVSQENIDYANSKGWNITA